MVRLKILSGSKAGTVWSARRFPIRIGRAAQSDLQLEEDGVWDQHLRLDLSPGEGFVVSVLADALASVNGQPIEQAVLRNGDLIDLGSLRLQFWLNETRQPGFRLREILTWLGIAAISLGQIGLIYWLLR